MSTLRPMLAAGLYLVCLLQTPALAAEQPAAPRKELVFLTWSEYIDPEVVEAFETKHNVKVSEVYYETDTMRDNLLVSAGGIGYDLMIVNGPSLEIYGKRNWLEPLDEKRIPNRKHIGSRWTDNFPSSRTYGVPYFWGTLGIGYRKDLVGAEMTSWMDLFKPAKGLHGKLAMLNDRADLIGMALKALGLSANSEDPEELKQAERLLLEQKPFVKGYSYVSLGEESGLATGELVAAMMYSGDALMVKEHNPNVAYVLPKEGGNIWVDYLVVLKSSKNKDLAHAFIDFLNAPKMAAQNAVYVHYASPNVEAERLLPDAFKADPIIYPSEQALAKSEVYKSLSARTYKRRNAIFHRIVQ